MEKVNSQFITNIKTWLTNDVDNGQELLDEMDHGLKNFTDFIEETFPNIAKDLSEFFVYLKEQLKIKDETEIVNELLNKGIESFFIKKSIDIIKKTLKIYFDTAYLRELSNKEFKYFIEKVIGDILIKRESSQVAIAENIEINLKNKEQVNVSISVIKYLFQLFYRTNLSYNDFKNIIINHTDIEESKVDIIIKFMKDEQNTERLERYFLFELLRHMDASIKEISATIEENYD